MTDRTQPPEAAAEPANPPGANLGKKRGRRLYSIANVRAALADVIRRLDTGEMETGKARVMVYALSTLAAVIQGSDLEARIAALEGRKP